MWGHAVQYGGEGGEEIVENETTFWYLRRPIDQKDYGWPAVRQNIMRAMAVWGVLGTLL